ncbi:hypothetical protein OHA77_12310 [Streptosporangium sp. NBC_01639]|uniref:hypothetical protein n=1 Tax=Streptosporangium sp. NBC_01639 TaxID=2975948 RepID=UPI003865A498|nr:hypothetical protein OHA77_12310 [Streptosporangium sp. NBC_01639]
MEPQWDDPEFRTFDAPQEWSWTTDGPVRYVLVTREGLPLGFLWVASMSDAAGFVPAATSGGAGMNASVAWVGRLRSAKAAGDDPFAALRRWAGEAEDALCGSVPVDAESEISSLAGLSELADRS